MSFDFSALERLTVVSGVSCPMSSQATHSHRILTTHRREHWPEYSGIRTERDTSKFGFEQKTHNHKTRYALEKKKLPGLLRHCLARLKLLWQPEYKANKTLKFIDSKQFVCHIACVQAKIPARRSFIIYGTHKSNDITAGENIARALSLSFRPHFFRLYVSVCVWYFVLCGARWMSEAVCRLLFVSHVVLFGGFNLLLLGLFFVGRSHLGWNIWLSLLLTGTINVNVSCNCNGFKSNQKGLQHFRNFHSSTSYIVGGHIIPLHSQVAVEA